MGMSHSEVVMVYHSLGLGTIWNSGNLNWVVSAQGKCSTHCTVSPNSVGTFWGTPQPFPWGPHETPFPYTFLSIIAASSSFSTVSHALVLTRLFWLSPPWSLAITPGPICCAAGSPHTGCLVDNLERTLRKGPRLVPWWHFPDSEWCWTCPAPAGQ